MQTAQMTSALKRISTQSQIFPHQLLDKEDLGAESPFWQQPVGMLTAAGGVKGSGRFAL